MRRYHDRVLKQFMETVAPDLPEKKREGDMSKLCFFSPQELKPEGWLRRQLEIQAGGLSGHLDQVWKDIRDSKWIGGDCDGWERVPYWLDGFIPLAYLLDDQDKIARAGRFIDAILSGQQEDGWLCPCSEEDRAGYDMWAFFLISKVLMLYYDCSGDERIPEAVRRAMKNLYSHIKEHPIFDWARFRWFECLIPIFRLYDMTQEAWLLDLGRLLRQQGTDYEKLYTDWPCKTPKRRWSQESHVVNQAMALKAGGLASLLDADEADDRFSEFMLQQLFACHGTAVGHFTGDECLAGLSPIQGTELCGVVEAMYSYELLFALTGRPVWADRLEKLAFNALPATLTPDMWAHQYDQQTNQVACVRQDPEHVVYLTNGGESGLYGLEPNFGCCTANFSQGWPKFALSVLMKSEDGVTAAAIAPVKLSAMIHDVKVQIECRTLYPFGHTVRYIVKTEAPVAFTLTLRVPGTARRAAIDGEEAAPGTLVPINRLWEGQTAVTLTLEDETRLIPRPTGLYTIERGALVYALAIGEEWTAYEYTKDGVERKFPYCDYEVRPTTEWQYALDVQDPNIDIVVHETGEIGDHPFAPESTACWLDVPAARISWGYEEEYRMVARATPLSAEPTGPTEHVRFIPYGCTNIRITELPSVKDQV